MNRNNLSMLALAIAVGMNATVAAQESDNAVKEDDAIEKIEIRAKRSPFSATKSNTPIVELARSVSIETMKDIETKGALNLSQTATYMAGVTGETYGFATRVDSVTSRGLSIPRYRDSIQELFGSYNSTRAEVYTMEQVELLKGPASVLYGQGSPGGLINYVSKTPKADADSEIMLQYGTFDRKQVGVDLNTSLSSDDTWLGRFVGLYRDAETQVDHVTDDTTVLMPSVTFAPTAATQFTLIGLFQDTDSDTAAQFIPIEGTLQPLADGSYLPDVNVYAGEPGFNRFNTKSNQVTLLGEHMFDADTSITMTALWRDGEADYHQAWPTFTGSTRYLNGYLGAPVLPTDTYVARTFYMADNAFEQHAVDVRLTRYLTTGAFEHEILAGIQYQNVDTDSNSAYYFGGGALQGDFRYALDLANPQYTGAPEQSVFDAIYNDAPEQSVRDTGYYLSDQITYGNWRITAGLRHDRVKNDNGTSTQDDSQTSYSAGVLYNLDNGLSPYVSYAESFETVVGLTIDGQQLEPEEGRQYEAGVKYAFSDIPGFLTLAWYDIKISNLPNPNSLPVEAAQQQGESNLSGIELEGRLVTGDVTTQFAFSTIDAEDPNGFELSAQPDKNASVWVAWEPQMWPGFRAGAGVRHVGGSVSENAALRFETPSYTLGDLMLGYAVTQQLDLQLNVRNITDKAYLTSCLTRGDCFPGLRRTVNATLKYRF